MHKIDKAIESLGLPYDIEYAVISLDDDEINIAQREFFGFLKEREANNLITALEERDISSRIYTNGIMADAKSMIILLFPYMTSKHDKNANLSLYTLGQDYHIYIKKQLNHISKQLKSYDEKADFYIQSDSGVLNERFFAFYSGIAMLGINSMIFSKLYGSYVNIALIVSNIKLEERRYERSYCDKCMACVRACPGSAIKGDFSIDPIRCASYITQKKGILSKQEQSIIKKSGKAFGCDICQNVCHFNNNVNIIPASYDIIGGIKYGDIADISNKKFKEKFADRAFAFRGKNVILRNLQCLGEESEQV